MIRRRPFLGLPLLVILSACSGLPWTRSTRPQNYAPPSDGFASARAAAAGPGWPTPEWWRGFRSRELETLIAAARDGNTDLAEAAARVVQADAQARIAGAALLPTLSASGGASTSRSTSSAAGARAVTSRRYDAGLTASWEIDLWGRNSAGLTGARATALASRATRDGVALTITASVANTYFLLLSLRDRLRYARDNLVNAERVLRIVQARVAAGSASELAVAQQRAQVAQQRAAMPTLERQERQALNALALLLGRLLPGFTVSGQTLADIQPVPVLTGMPSELLQRRPDIVAAEGQIAAADANVAAARAALYPSISLTGDAGVVSAALSSLLNRGNAISIALSLVGPIFDGGRRRGQIELAEGRRLELLESYRGAILGALADVEDALIAVDTARRRELELGTAVQAARAAFTLAEAQYQQGAIGLFELLDSQRTLFSTLDAQVSARNDHLGALVALYRTLGGGWTTQDH